MRRTTRTRQVAPSTLQDFILSHISRTQASRESISYMISCIREHGMSFPTNLNYAESEFEKLGFRLDRECNKYGSVLRTYVTL